MALSAAVRSTAAKCHPLQSRLLTFLKGTLRVTGQSDISNQNKVKGKRNKHDFPTHFRTRSCPLRKRKSNPFFGSLLQWRMNTPYTEQKQLWGTSQAKQEHRDSELSQEPGCLRAEDHIWGAGRYVHMHEQRVENRAGGDQQQAEQALSSAELELWGELLKHNISSVISDSICLLPHITGIICITEFKGRVVLGGGLQSLSA